MIIEGSPDILDGPKNVSSMGAWESTANQRPGTMEMFVAVAGRKPSSVYGDETYAQDQDLIHAINDAIYSNIGANLDVRDWSAIMASSNPLKAAQDALKAMYSDPNYQAVNLAYTAAQGYTKDGVDLTYRQMTERVGSSNPTAYQNTDIGKEVISVVSSGDDVAIKKYSDQLVSDTGKKLQSDNTELTKKIQKVDTVEVLKSNIENTTKTVAQKFHDYIYASADGDATAATAKGLAWYDANRSAYTPAQFVALWNESEGTSFTVTDLDNALVKAGYKPSTTMLTKQTTNATSSALPLILAAAAAYFFGA